MGKKRKRYSPRFRFQVALDVLKGNWDAVEIARAHDLHPTTVALDVGLPTAKHSGALRSGIRFYPRLLAKICDSPIRSVDEVGSI